MKIREMKDAFLDVEINSVGRGLLVAFWFLWRLGVLGAAIGCAIGAIVMGYDTIVTGWYGNDEEIVGCFLAAFGLMYEFKKHTIENLVRNIANGVASSFK